MQRYESYKSSGLDWLGEVPSHWGLKKSKFLWREREDRSLLGDEQLLSVSQYSGVVPRVEDSRSESLEDYKRCEPNDLVINIMLAWMSGIGVSKYSGIVSPAYCVYRQLENHNPSYFDYLYRTPQYLAEFARRSKGIVPSRWRMYTEDFGQILSLLPPRDEQDRIVAFLDQKIAEIDAAIAKKERLIELLNEQRGVLIDTAVTRGVMSDAAMHPSNLPGIEFVPTHWQILQLKRVVETKITDGPHETPIFLDEGVPFVSVEAAFDGRIDLEKRRGYIAPKEHVRYCQKLKPQRDDIFFVKSGSTTGKTVIVDFDDEFSVWSPLALIRPKRDFFKPRFLLCALQSPYFQRQVQTGWSYGTQPNIGMSDLEKLWVAMPPINEQVLILDSLRPRLETIDETVSLIRRELAELQHWKNTLIAESVTGKIKV